MQFICNIILGHVHEAIVAVEIYISYFSVCARARACMYVHMCVCVCVGVYVCARVCGRARVCVGGGVGSRELACAFARVALLI